jgi:L-ascorbate metabolism protein UlaG (beta-lactamase superfamily)
MKRLLSVLAVMAVVTMFLFSAAYAGTGDVTITFWGQSAFKLESGGKTVLIDPWITENPLSPVTVDDITKADLILITHDHFDHIGDTAAGGHAADTIAIAKKTGAQVVAVFETAARLLGDGLPPQNILFGGFGKDIGGPTDFNGITLYMTPAVHSSNSGVSVGYIVKFPGGATIYHAGDTAIFADMLTWGSLYPIDLALVPIGGSFTMDASQAAKSLRLLTPKKTIPMHYASFPGILAPNADEFVSLAKRYAPGVGVIVLKPGEKYILQPCQY